MAEVRREERDRIGWLAWHSALLQRMDPKKFPPLDKMLSRKPQARQQTREEIIANLKAAFGYPGKDA